jgi:hypothetical protein
MKRTGLQVIEQGNVRGQRSGRRLALWGCGAVMVLAVGLVLIGGYRILDAIATRVADERLAPEKDAYRAQHGAGEASGTSGKQDETPQEDKHVSMH